MNPEQWQRADEFIPERFDSDSPYFLTPDGKVRSPVAYIPFSLGPRNCLGQVLALAELRSLFAYFVWNFRLSVVNDEVLRDPFAHYCMKTKYKLNVRIEEIKQA